MLFLNPRWSHHLNREGNNAVKHMTPLGSSWMTGAVYNTGRWQQPSQEEEEEDVGTELHSRLSASLAGSGYTMRKNKQKRACVRFVNVLDLRILNPPTVRFLSPQLENTRLQFCVR